MKRIIMVLMIILVAMGTVMAEEAVSPDTEQFLSDLSYELRQRGWDEEEIGMLLQQATLMNWEGMRRADPAIVAYALHYGAHNGIDTTREMAMTRAQLAVQLAIETEKLTRLGYGVQAVASGAARGVGDVVARLREQKQVMDGESTGEMVRNTIRNEVAIQQKTSARNSFDKGKSPGDQIRPFGQGGNPFGNRPGNAGK